MNEPRSLDIRIDLLGPVIASAHAATSTLAQTHDFIPGAMLLGVVASRLYASLDANERRVAFHGGGVNYGDANPADDLGNPCWPMPFAFHSSKGASSWPEGAPPPDHVTNLAALEARATGTQWEQYRRGYVGADGRRVSVTRQRALKTAIDPVSRRAADAQLFGLEAIAPGQTFIARITYSDAVSEALECRIADALLGANADGQELRIGRSRSAEFGRIQVSRVQAAAPDWEAASADGLHRIWVLSDIVVPPTSPTPNGAESDRDTDALQLALGLEGALRPNLSFLRWRAHQPFNAHWKARGMERVAIERGSVLTIEARDSDAARLAVGLGIDREAGFGRIAVDARPLLAPKLTFPLKASQSKEDGTAGQQVLAGDPPPGVARWIAARLEGAMDLERERETIAKIVVELRKSYERAARMGGGTPFTIGPSAQQWGAVRTVLERDAPNEQLENQLFGEHGCARGADADWGARTGRDKTFSSQLQTLFHDHGTLPPGRRILTRAVRAIAEEVRSADEVTR
jgi:hypothetical protein